MKEEQRCSKWSFLLHPMEDRRLQMWEERREESGRGCWWWDKEDVVLSQNSKSYQDKVLNENISKNFEDLEKIFTYWYNINIWRNVYYILEIKVSIHHFLHMKIYLVDYICVSRKNCHRSYFPNIYWKKKLNDEYWKKKILKNLQEI